MPLLPPRACWLAAVLCIGIFALSLHLTTFTAALPKSLPDLSSNSIHDWYDQTQKSSLDRNQGTRTPASFTVSNSPTLDKSSLPQFLGGQQDIPNAKGRKGRLFDHVYVVSLPNRQDRRDQMRRVAQALQLDITFVDAVSSTDPLITFIAEKVYEVRQQKARHLAKIARSRARGKTELVGGMGVGTVWLAADGLRGDSGKKLQLPSTDDWVTDLYTAVEAGHTPRPKDPHFDITTMLYDPLETIPSRQLNPAVLSTWYSHVEAWRAMQRNGDKTALFLEDDIDIEWDFSSKWSAIEGKLPKEWHTVFAGHCWGREMTYPTGLHPHLFHSNIPRCLHGYAMSQSGVSTILPYTRDPWTAFQAPIDVLIPTLLLYRPLNAYSVDPPLIIQAKELESDIQPGIGSKWRGQLGDSTLNRLWRSDGKEPPRLSWEAEWKDPAVNRPHKEGQSW